MSNSFQKPKERVKRSQPAAPYPTSGKKKLKLFSEVQEGKKSFLADAHHMKSSVTASGKKSIHSSRPPQNIRVCQNLNHVGVMVNLHGRLDKI